MKREFLNEFFRKYIEGTPYKAIVAERKMFLCHLTKAVRNGLAVHDTINGAYITSRSLKHLFDKKPAEEFMFLLNNLHRIVKYPDKIYQNKSGKRGEFCLTKRIDDSEYLCSIEIVEVSSFKEIQLATAFRLRDDKYIKNYALLWDWGNGSPHRSAFDAPEGSTNAPQ